MTIESAQAEDYRDEGGKEDAAAYYGLRLPGVSVLHDSSTSIVNKSLRTILHSSAVEPTVPDI
jgi:hypothetical protein